MDNTLIYTAFLLVGYLGWLVLFSDSFNLVVKPKCIPHMKNFRQLLVLVATFMVVSQTTIFAVFIASPVPIEHQFPWVLPVTDINRFISPIELFLQFLRLLFLEEIPRIGLWLLFAYLLRNITPFHVNLGVALLFSSVWFAMIHDFPTILLISAVFVGACLTLIALKHGLVVSALLHTLLNHHKLGLFFPHFPPLLTILLVLVLNSLMLIVLWRYLFSSAYMKEEPKCV
jgi:hypothetical protein